MSNTYKLIIQGTLPGLNEMISCERKNRYAGAKLKKDAETLVRYHIRQQLRGKRPKTPVMLYYRFFEPTRRRDKDNIASFAHKIIQDSLVKEGVLANDGWDYVEGFVDMFSVDKKKPRIELTIVEPEEEQNENTCCV